MAWVLFQRVHNVIVEGCDQDGARSLNTTKVETAGLRVNSKGKKTILCKEHYNCLLYTSDAADDTPCVDLGHP